MKGGKKVDNADEVLLRAAALIIFAAATAVVLYYIKELYALADCIFEMC